MVHLYKVSFSRSYAEIVHYIHTFTQFTGSPILNGAMMMMVVVIMMMMMVIVVMLTGTHPRQ